MPLMRIPRATCRLQLNRNFRLEQAIELLPFLRKIGISDLYLSPVSQARKGSTHGYDVTNPLKVNPEVGGAEWFDKLCAELQAREMGLIIDIVPNHMAASSENPWWMDVLENGPSSRFSSFFDVGWSENALSGSKIFLPILGDPFGTVLENRQIQLAVDDQGICFTIYSSRLPVDPSTYIPILRNSPAEFEGVVEALRRLPDRNAREWEGVEARRHDSPGIKERLWAVVSGSEAARQWLEARLATLNQDVDRLEQLLRLQAYRIAWWRVARERVNYRRFFDVSDLIALRQEDVEVFHATHGLVFDWIKRGCVTGLRVDHVDGLFNPRQYLARLGEHTEARPYIVVEKILIEDELLPEDWPIAGSTGYDYLGVLNNLFIDPAGLVPMQATYARFTGLSWTLEDAGYQQKRWITQHLFQSEMYVLEQQLSRLAELDRHACDVRAAELRRGLSEVTACLPVYRTYVESPEHVDERDGERIKEAIASARERNPDMASRVFDFLERVLLLRFLDTASDEQRQDWVRFVIRWQQLTGPITAKGVEDTAYYLYNRLISMNEVGGRRGAVSTEEFHRFNEYRAAHWPAAMNATSTHDTKRSEDVRARLNVLSEMPGQWDRLLFRWSRWNRGKKSTPNAPDPNEEIMLYQSMLGTWPLHDGEIPGFVERLKQFVVKAVREAKVYSSWIQPDEDHERAIFSFIDQILSDDRFRSHFREFQQTLAWYGALNSLSQVLLKATSPGVPDFYQSQFLWDFSFVDPDNRRPVDVEQHLRLAAEMDEWRAGDLLEHWRDGRIKAFVTQRALARRVGGDYLPLRTDGENAVAFARRDSGQWSITVVPRFVSRLGRVGRLPFGPRAWKTYAIHLPDDAPRRWTNAFTGETVQSNKLSDMLRTFPVALLHNA